MMTVGAPGGRILPVGLGIGATQLVKAIMSPTRAAGRLLIITVEDPLETIPGPAGMQGGIMHGAVLVPTTAAGILAISTLGTAPAGMSMIGIGGCGIGVGVGAGGWIGAWQCGPSCIV